MRHPEKPTEQQNSATSGTVSKAHMTGGRGQTEFYQYTKIKA